MNTPILFIVFNRPSTTKKVFHQIRSARPSKLYIAADGPRKNRDNEKQVIDQVRRIATNVDWPCHVETLFRDENLGCRWAVNGAIDWFFSNEESGIILEDDCLPHPDFFQFCQELLTRYSTDSRIGAITGCNFQNGVVRGKSSYYYSRFNHVWGWASWRRAWALNDPHITFWKEWKESEEWSTFWENAAIRAYWEQKFDAMYNNQIDTWDYAWLASSWKKHLMTITPQNNLISNIGYGKEATHTVNSFFSNQGLNQPVYSLSFPLKNPDKIERSIDADNYVAKRHYGGPLFRLKVLTAALKLLN